MNALLHSRAFPPNDLVDAGQALLKYGIQLHRLDEQLMRATIKIAVQSGTTVYDAVYIALAQEHRWKFITADERMACRVRTSIEDVSVLLLS
ncbi:MAG: type II toxin-antitoxin system VapC family toxin [Candidatus Thorarchaeota archaeon]|nr:type II toxin-antitoxin system VapC family toxin [Candidatus Thorarchaeota archaeon]